MSRTRYGDNRQWMTEEQKALHAKRLTEFIKYYKIRRRNGMLVLYKAVRLDLGSWYTRSESSKAGLSGVYKPGTKVTCRKFSRNPHYYCAPGLHVTTKGFAMDFDTGAPTIIRVLVRPDDVICVPTNQMVHGQPTHKIRVKRLYVDRIVIRNKIRAKWGLDRGYC